MTKYIILDYFHNWAAAYFVDWGSPALAKEPYFENAYQEKCIYRYSKEIYLVPRISYIKQQGPWEQYKRIVDSVWEISFEEWNNKYNTLHCYWLPVNDSTREYIAEEEFFAWIVELSNDQTIDYEIIPHSGYFSKDGEELTAIVIPNTQRP